LKEFGLTEQQYNVLRILKGQRGKPLSLFEVQERMLHRMSNATRIVEKLRLKGLVDRMVCEENRRQVEISITEEGKRLLKRVQPEVNALQEDLAAEIDEDEAETLHGLLERVRASYRSIENEPE
jgi:DNA-binding MarR family transcriptional regulator